MNPRTRRHCCLVLAALLGPVVSSGDRPTFERLFEFSGPYSTSNSPLRLGSADFDRDGLADLAVIHGDRDHVGIRLNLGPRLSDPPLGLSPEVVFFAGLNSQPRSLDIADFDQDGLPDVVVSGSGNETLTIMWNMGGDAEGWDGLAAETIFDSSDLDELWQQQDLPGVPGLSYVVAGDLDNDTLDDLVVAVTYSIRAFHYTRFLVVWNDGQGQFSEGILLGDRVAHTTAAAVGDFNNDQYADFVAVATLGPGVYVRMNNGTSQSPRAGFAAPTNHASPLATFLNSPIAEDVDVDGDIDIMFGSEWEFKSGVFVLYNEGGDADNWLGFEQEPQRVYTPGDAPTFGVFSVTTLQLHGNPEPEVAAVIYSPSVGPPTLVILSGFSNSFRELTRWQDDRFGPYEVIAAQLDGRRSEDLAFPANWFNQLTVLLGP